MEELVKKLEELKKAIKAVKKLNPPTHMSLPQVPSLPAIKPPAPPSMTPPATTAPKISSGEGPNSKKDPKKVAQQIKDGSMSTKTAKVMLKTDKKTGQWSLEPTEPASV